MIQKGIVAVSGKAIGKAFVLCGIPQITGEEKSRCEKEVAVQHIRKVIDSLAEIMEKKLCNSKMNINDMQKEIIEMQRTILTDKIFYDNIICEVMKGYSPEAAVYRCVEEQCKMLEALDDSYLAERVGDFRDVGERLICGLLGIEYPDLSNLDEEVIVIGENVPPSLLADGDSSKICGLLMEKGSKTAHVCILAANMGIPVLVGCKGLKEIENREVVFLNAVEGYAKCAMSGEELIQAQQNVREYQKKVEELQIYKKRPAVTKDGKKIELHANIMDTGHLDQVIENGLDGIGLFRTEFLYMNRNTLPGEMEQYAVYKNVVMKMAPHVVTIRTMDIGGDKEVEALELPQEQNPFLGYRAIRICLDRTDLFKTQLRAILRASIHGKIQMMFPMISSMEELDRALGILESVKEELNKEGVAYDINMPIGIMVEVPSTAVMADAFIKKVDFFSIGSNDLTGYTIAVDRQNEKMEKLYDYFHPSVLKLIEITIKACKDEGKSCSLCGEMAADPMAVPVLIGMGLRKFSVNSAAASRVKKELEKWDVDMAEKLVFQIKNLDSAVKIKDVLRRYKEVD